MRPPCTAKGSLTPGGILRISDPADNCRLIYARYDTLNSTDNAIFEINCRIISTGDSNGVGFGFIDTEKSLEVGLFEGGSIFVFLKDPLGVRSTPFITNDTFHTYRIVKNGNVNMEVWAGGNKVLDIVYDDLAPRTSEFPEHQRECFSTSTPETSEWDIAYVSYSISP